ncbi:MAG: hypothetical protein JSS38_03955 [Nitrospira sp.]|nr:hypothetical protein [Nitrospira sp.]
METGVVDGRHRTEHAGAYATLDDRQVQLSWNLLLQHGFDGHKPVGDWIYMRLFGTLLREGKQWVYDEFLP